MDHLDATQAMLLVDRASLAFSGWSNLEVGQKPGKLSVVDQVLAVAGRLLQRLWFDFLGWLLLKLWVRVLSGVVCLYSQQLSRAGDKW